MRYAVVMAGGAGTRLWPAATRQRPKQLQRLVFEQPLIVETVERLAKIYDLERILIVTADRYVEPICEVLPQLPPQNIIGEPFGRNTAAAIALAALRIDREDPNAIFAVFPADHVILKPQALYAALRFAEELATEHRVVDIGVPPSHAETGYGYIELGDELKVSGDSTAYRVKRFVEKPNLEQAQAYLEGGMYIWNSGMFVWQASKFLQALEEHLPDTYAKLSAAFESGDASQMERAYGEIQDISVDYAIMEKVSDVVAVPVDFGWRDVGDWAALYDLMDKDANGNVLIGRHVPLDTEGCLLLSGDRTIATVGLRDLVVVETDDVLLIIPRNRTQEVKQLLEGVKDAGLETLL